MNITVSKFAVVHRWSGIQGIPAVLKHQQSRQPSSAKRVRAPRRQTKCEGKSNIKGAIGQPSRSVWEMNWLKSQRWRRETGMRAVELAATRALGATRGAVLATLRPLQLQFLWDSQYLLSVSRGECETCSEDLARSGAHRRRRDSSWLSFFNVGLSLD